MATIYGDAVYETSSISNESNSWYGDYSRCPYSNTPFFARGGGYYYYDNAGIFCFSNTASANDVLNSFHPTIVVY